jgi:hypothetical protein
LRATRAAVRRPTSTASWSVLEANCSTPNAATRAMLAEVQPMAKLLNRFGRRLAALTDLKIEYPVGREGTRFEARLVAGALYNLDATQLRFFVILDDHGDDYPAMIDYVGPSESDLEQVLIRGVVVADGRRSDKR